MRTYDFAPIAAREFPTVRLLDHPHIWGGVRFCVNVSEKAYSPELEDAMRSRGIEWIHYPVSEEPGEKWLPSLFRALRRMREAHRDWKKIVVHCDGGNNRSKTFIEAFCYVLTQARIADEYKGEMNHLAYNCKIGHLPPLNELEVVLAALRELDDIMIKSCFTLENGLSIDVETTIAESIAAEQLIKDDPDKYQGVEGRLEAIRALMK